MTTSTAILSESLIRHLLDRHAPDLAGLPLRLLDHHGTETFGIRVGAAHLLRLPRDPAAAPALRVAATWLPALAPHLPLQVPEVIAQGTMDTDPPTQWALHRWLPGQDAASIDPEDPRDTADRLAGFIRALAAVPVPPDAPRGRRGGALAPQDDALRAALDRAQAMGLDEAMTARPIWEAGLDVPPHDGPPVWLHGDLMPANLIVQRGRLSGVIDWSDLTTGDPAYDLIPAWFQFDMSMRSRFLATLDPDAATLARARARVAWQCAMALPHYRDTNPMMVRMARRGLHALAQGEGS